MPHLTATIYEVVHIPHVFLVNPSPPIFSTTQSTSRPSAQPTNGKAGPQAPAKKRSATPAMPPAQLAQPRMAASAGAAVRGSGKHEPPAAHAAAAPWGAQPGAAAVTGADDAAAGRGAALLPPPPPVGADEVQWRSKLGAFLGHKVQVPRLSPGAPPLELKQLWKKVGGLWAVASTHNPVAGCWPLMHADDRVGVVKYSGTLCYLDVYPCY